MAHIHQRHKCLSIRFNRLKMGDRGLRPILGLLHAFDALIGGSTLGPLAKRPVELLWLSFRSLLVSLIGCIFLLQTEGASKQEVPPTVLMAVLQRSSGTSRPLNCLVHRKTINTANVAMKPTRKATAPSPTFEDERSPAASSNPALCDPLRC